MITVFSGAGRTLRLLAGFRTLLDDRDLAVVVNTSDVMQIDGRHLCCGLDSVMFLFAGILNQKSGRGIQGDSTTTGRFLAKIGRKELIPAGDRERAVQIAREGLIQEGYALTGATAFLSEALGIGATILPMTDMQVATLVDTRSGPLPILDYQTNYRKDEEPMGVALEYLQQPIATEEVIGCIRRSEAVIIGPENPLTVIAPILACRGIRTALRNRFVIALSPFCGSKEGDRELAAYLSADKIPPSSAGVHSLLSDIADCFVIDQADPAEIEGAVRLDTAMTGRGKSESLAWDLLSIIRAAQ
jgi:LPPG:FO 2-phospho-L-lactate transferase